MAKAKSKTSTTKSTDDSTGGQISATVGDLIGKAGEMKTKITEAQADVVGIEKMGSAAGGKVKAKSNGAGDLTSIKIDPDMMGDDPAVLEELILTAVADSRAKVRDAAGTKLQEMLSWLPFPPALIGVIAQYIPSK